MYMYYAHHNLPLNNDNVQANVEKYTKPNTNIGMTIPVRIQISPSINRLSELMRSL